MLLNPKPKSFRFYNQISKKKRFLKFKKKLKKYLNQVIR